MKVGVGYCDNLDTTAAGKQVIKDALNQAGRTDPCDMVLLFSTARHDAALLREAVVSVIGKSIPIYGGGAAGIITNESYGYAGDQIGAACIWLDGVQCNVLTEGGLKDSEEETGKRLGKRLAGQGAKPDSPILLFYDTVDTTHGFRMLMATPLLNGIEKGLGFPPQLSGVGMIGDHNCCPMDQWIGSSIGKSNVISLAFSGNIRMDSVIMHGCRPSTRYYTVTKAAGQVILEINGEPAIPFIDKLLGSAIVPEQYPFFLMFGVNHGERWGAYNEDYYASRVCLGIDKKRNGIVMFESDMVAGTEFQLMHRSLDLDYIKSKIEKAFQELGDREPVFGMFIDCAGRCAGYAGIDFEDAVAIQQAVTNRIPLLGLYNGVEIAPIGGRSRGLDWTGVFCLFSQSKDVSISQHAVGNSAVWRSSVIRSQPKEVPLKAMAELCEQNAAKILALDAASVAIRFELEQKRHGFSLLAELTTSLQHSIDQEHVLLSIIQRINTALHMQRTIVLKKNKKGQFVTAVLQGYSANEKAAFARRTIDVPEELLTPTIVTGADSEERLKEFRTLLGLPYFVSSPITIQGKISSVLITGRLVEALPYLSRLNHQDVETIQAICAFLASVRTKKRLAAAEEQNRIMVNTIPICCLFWNENGTLIDCNQEALTLFEMPNKEAFFKLFITLSSEEQSENHHSTELSQEIKKAFITGSAKFNWTYITAEGERIPTKITLFRMPKGENYILAGYVEDMRNQDAAARYIDTKNKFLASINHELRTPLNAIQSMARIVEEAPNLVDEAQNLNENQKEIIHHGMRSVGLLTSAIETILDFSSLDSGHLTLKNAQFSIKEMMEAITEIVREDVEEKSLYFRVSIDPHIPEFVLGDSNRLRQALLNIVRNAIKFTETGGVDIHIFPEHNDRISETSIAFAVKDSGIGIQEEHCRDLFKPFFAEDISYTRKRGGLGMGLAVSNSLIALMGGRITCQSRLGEGSTFIIHVSLPKPKEHTAQAEDVGHRIAPAALRGMRVLVAEDNKINQMIMKELLTSAGIEVTIADNGVKALERLYEGVFDLILMDIQMPEMDGLTAATQIRSDARYASLPILAMTANASADNQRESLRVGMNAHLTKPVNVEELYRTVNQWRSSEPE